MNRFRFDPTRSPLEDVEQVTVMQWAQHCRLTPIDRRLSELLIHIPNAARRSMAVARSLKRQGLAPGFPDLLLPVPSGPHGLLAIEMKRRDRSDSRIEPNQVEWQAKLTAVGQRSVFCFGADEAMQEIRRYLRGSQFTLIEYAQIGAAR